MILKRVHIYFLKCRSLAALSFKVGLKKNYLSKFFKLILKLRTQIPYDLSPLLPYDVQNFRIDAPYGHTLPIKILEP